MNGRCESLIHYLNLNHPPLSGHVIDDNNVAPSPLRSLPPSPSFSLSLHQSSVSTPTSFSLQRPKLRKTNSLVSALRVRSCWSFVCRRSWELNHLSPCDVTKGAIARCFIPGRYTTRWEKHWSCRGPSSLGDVIKGD